MLNAPLSGSYAVAEVTAAEWQAVFAQYQATVFPHETAAASFEPLLTASEHTRLAALRQNLAGARQLHLLVLAAGEPVGWHYGFQRGDLEYFMANTGLLPAHQGRGVYSALLPVLVEWARATGFQYLTSLHHSDNNAVLVPKLKAGFVLQAFGYLLQPMLLEANVGPMVQLVYPLRDEYRPYLGFWRGVPGVAAP